MLPVFQNYDVPVSVPFKAADTVVGEDGHAFVCQMFLYEGGDFPVHHGHDMAGFLHDGDVAAEEVEVLRHLQPDEARADDDGLFLRAGQLRKVRLDGVGVGHVLEGEDARRVHSWQVRAYGDGAGRQHQLVVAFGVLLAAVHLPAGDGFCVPVDGRDFRAYAHVEVEAVAEGGGRLQEQAVPFGNGVADIVGEAAVRVRHIAAFFDQDDFGLLVHAAETCGCGGSAGHTANDNILHDYIF